jgi:phosphoesterase RecJ-like protein
MDQIIRHIKDAQYLLIASHAEPDGDAVGSLIAFGLALRKFGKKATLYNASPIPAVYRFLPGVEQIERNIKAAHTYDTAIMLDCGDLVRVGEAAAKISKIPRIINIDHQYPTRRHQRMRHSRNRAPFDQSPGDTL